MHLDIISPAHNEQHRIDSTPNGYRSACPDDDVRIVVALDDCTDSTSDVVAAHCSDDPRVSIASYPRLGKGGVVSESLRRSEADYVAFVDADGATPPDELLRLVETCDSAGTDIAIASRYHPASVLPASRGRGRAAASKVFAMIVRRLFGMRYWDTQCGAKVMRRAVAERITPLLSSRDFVFDVELLHLARTLGYSDGGRCRQGRAGQASGAVVRHL